MNECISIQCSNIVKHSRYWEGTDLADANVVADLGELAAEDTGLGGANLDGDLKRNQNQVKEKADEEAREAPCRSQERRSRRRC